MPADSNQNSQSVHESVGWLATRRSVCLRAAKIAMVVGIILAGINHGDKAIGGTLSFMDAWKIGLTFLVPYCVSTFSSVLAIRERTQLVTLND